MQPSRKLTLDEFKYALNTVNSRGLSFGCKKSETWPKWFEHNGQCVVLVPVFDMVNHNNRIPNCYMQVLQPNMHSLTISVITAEDINAGDELFIDYGQEFNDREHTTDHKLF